MQVWMKDQIKTGVDNAGLENKGLNAYIFT